MHKHGLMICPLMDWSAPDRAQTFKEFHQISGIWFKVKGVQAENQHNYIILWSSCIGLRMFNTWGLTDEQLKDSNNIWEKISEQIETPENFCIHRTEFQHFRQRYDGSVDDFYTHCKSKATKCKFQTGLNKKNGSSRSWYRASNTQRSRRNYSEKMTSWNSLRHLTLLTPTKQRHPTWLSSRASTTKGVITASDNSKDSQATVEAATPSHLVQIARL